MTASRWVLGALALAACGPKWEESSEDGLRVLEADVTTSRSGKIKLPIQLEDGETGLLATFTGDEAAALFVAGLSGPKGLEALASEDYWEQPNSYSNGIFSSPVDTFAWPWSADADPLSAGKWRLDVGSDTAHLGVHAHLVIDADPDLTVGTLQAEIVLAGSTGTDTELIAALDEAVDHWKDLYEAVGITVETSQTTWQTADALSAPGHGDGQTYEDIAAATGLRTVRIVVVENIAGYDDIYGISGDIPGPMTATSRSAVLLSALYAEGPTTGFSPADRRILGETLAHEVGHYLGLYHPVETTWDLWDGLDDTTECAGEQSCIDALADNLMFPFPVCGFASCTPQEGITDDQSGVLHRNPFVD